MLAILGKWISVPDQRSPAAVRGVQKLAVITQKITRTEAALQAAKRAVSGLVLRERAGLQLAEAMLIALIAGQGEVDRAALCGVQAEVALISAQIGTISALVAQATTRLSVLREAAIAARALRAEHIDHCWAVDQALSDTGPEAADRLLARLPQGGARTGCCTLFGGAAKLQLRIG